MIFEPFTEKSKFENFSEFTLHTVMKNIAASEGTRALFAGLNAKLLRLCPAGGVMMMMNEIVYDYLTTNYPLDK